MAPTHCVVVVNGEEHHLDLSRLPVSERRVLFVGRMGRRRWPTRVQDVFDEVVGCCRDLGVS